MIDFKQLEQFTNGYAYPADYPSSTRILLSPRHDGKAALAYLLDAAQESMVGGMYGFDDEQIAAIYKAKCLQPNFMAMLSLDHTQRGGKHETDILSTMNAGAPGTSIAIGDVVDAVMKTIAEGTSSVKGAISHLKQWVLDSRYVLDGSMNESTSGEQWQNNSLIVIDDRVIAAQVQTNLMLVHTEMLKQMADRAARAQSQPA